MDGVEDVKKAFLLLAKEGASLVSKFETKFKPSEHDDDEEEVIEEELIEEHSLAAAKAKLMSFQKDMNKKIAPAKDDGGASMFEKTESVEADC